MNGRLGAGAGCAEAAWCRADQASGAAKDCGSASPGERSPRTGNGGRGGGTRRSTHGAGKPHEQRRHSVRQRRWCEGARGTRRVVLRRLVTGLA